MNIDHMKFSPLDPEKLNWYPKSSLPPEIPAIDISKVNTDENLIQFLADIRKSGLFYIVGHGIPEEVPMNAYNAFREFCTNLPEKIKVTYHTDPLFKNGGYVPFAGSSVSGGNQGKKVVKDWVTKYFWRGPSVVNRCHNDNFRETHDEYHRQTAELAGRVIRTIHRALKTRFPDFDPAEYEEFINPDYMFFNNRIYPEIPPDSDETAQHRLVPHRDMSWITLANQLPADNGYKGLFVVKKDGSKVHVPPIRNSYLVFVGQSMSYMTKKFIPAVYHGVDGPPLDQLQGSERSALISFCEPHDIMIPSKNINPKEDEIEQDACTFYDICEIDDNGTTWKYISTKFAEGYYGKKLMQEN